MANRWFPTMTQADVDARNAKVKASRTHRFPVDAKPLPVAPKAHASIEWGSQESPSSHPTPLESKNSAISKVQLVRDGVRMPLVRKISRYKPPAMRESAVLTACQAVLEAHPVVALWWRQNTGAVKFPDSRYVKFSFKGAPDLMGVLVGGRYFAVECKATGKKATAAQQSFLDNVRDAGGLAMCCDDPAPLWELLSSRHSLGG